MAEATSLSLLQRLRSRHDSADWARFVALYEPLLRHWLRRKEVLAHDADDLVQNVMSVVVRRVSEFEHNGRTGAFRAWLKAITFHCVRDYCRARRNHPPGTGGSEFQGLLHSLADPESDASRLWDEDHDRYVMKQMLEQLRDEFEPVTWQAFQGFALQSRPAAEVARELGVTPNAVFIAKSRVLSRLRQESAGLLDE